MYSVHSTGTFAVAVIGGERNLLTRLLKFCLDELT